MTWHLLFTTHKTIIDGKKLVVLTFYLFITLFTWSGWRFLSLFSKCFDLITQLSWVLLEMLSHHHISDYRLRRVELPGYDPHLLARVVLNEFDHLYDAWSHRFFSFSWSLMTCPRQKPPNCSWPWERKIWPLSRGWGWWLVPQEQRHLPETEWNKVI